MSHPPPASVIVHPLVLLSVVDHWRRVARDTRKRVVGVLLGERLGSGATARVDITNSFAVPFEEDERDPAVWFFDHSYAESMLAMFRKVNARERVVGWYSTAPRLTPADLAIHDVVARLCPSPVLLVCRAAPRDAAPDGRPTTAYAAVDAAREDGSRAGTRAFVNVPTEVGATEAEEVGVEHLLRDVRDGGVGGGPGGGVGGARTPGGDAAALATGVAGLASRLAAAAAYADAVADGRLPANHDVLADLQAALNDAPSLAGAAGADLAAALGARANDGALATYVGAATRAVLALHALVDNREAAAAAKGREEGGAADGDAKKKEAAGDGKEEGEGKENGAAAGGDKK